jgi:cupredoxin-like protein
MFSSKTRLAFASLLVTVAACGGAGGYGSTAPPPPPPPPPPNTVTATNSEVFTPSTLTVHAGQAVTFSFGSLAHNVFFTQAAGVPADIAGNNSSVSIARTFQTAGTYQYTCHIHPQMHGTVVVQ